MKRIIAGLAAVLASFLLYTGTAGAHVLFVTNRGNGEVREHWVGGRGAGHGKGLVVACERHRDNGRSAAQIDTPWNPPENCRHF